VTSSLETSSSGIPALNHSTAAVYRSYCEWPFGSPASRNTCRSSLLQFLAAVSGWPAVWFQKTYFGLPFATASSSSATSGGIGTETSTPTAVSPEFGQIRKPDFPRSSHPNRRSQSSLRPDHYCV
jgi:hypothetical protein